MDTDGGRIILPPFISYNSGGYMNKKYTSLIIALLMITLYSFVYADSTGFNSIKLSGDSTKVGSTTTVTVLLRDVNDKVILCSGTTVPGAESGYAKGCIFIKTDGGSGTTFYVNVGSSTSASFAAGGGGGGLSGYTATTNNMLRANGTTWESVTPPFSWSGTTLTITGMAKFNTAVSITGNLSVSGNLSATGYNSSSWDTAYGWGNHADAGYLIASTQDKTNWNSAYSWGDHSIAGYLVASTADKANWNTAYSWGNHADAGYLIASTSDKANWNTAYGWGNHADAGYLIASTADKANWNTAYGWGNHADAGYLIASTQDKANWNTAYTSTTALSAVNGIILGDGNGQYSGTSSVTITNDGDISIDDGKFVYFGSTNSYIHNSAGLLTIVTDALTGLGIEIDSTKSISIFAHEWSILLGSLVELEAGAILHYDKYFYFGSTDGAYMYSGSTGLVEFGGSTWVYKGTSFGIDGAEVKIYGSSTANMTIKVNDTSGGFEGGYIYLEAGNNTGSPDLARGGNIYIDAGDATGDNTEDPGDIYLRAGTKGHGGEGYVNVGNTLGDDGGLVLYVPLMMLGGYIHLDDGSGYSNIKASGGSATFWGQDSITINSGGNLYFGTTDTDNVYIGSTNTISQFDGTTLALGTLGSPKIYVGSTAATYSLYGTGTVNRGFNYVTAGGADNAISVTLQDAYGANVPLQAGLRLLINTGSYTLQAGINTIEYNGTTKDLKSHYNSSNNITNAYSAGSIVDVVYNGSVFVDMSQ